jgi:hypothetical protein
MSSNPYANKVSIVSTTEQILATVDGSTGQTIGNLVQKFLVTVSQATYDPLVAALFTAVNSYSTTSKPRVLLTIDDGSVAIDTSKSQSTNIWTNFTNKIKIGSTGSAGGIAVTAGTAGGNVINENHQGRPEILIALLSNNGTGFAKRYSSSIGANLLYYSVRIGLSTEQPEGIFRVSIPELI